MDEKKTINRVVGLKYEPEKGAPTVLLKGVGATADDVLDEAQRLGVGPKVVKDKKLLEQLYRLPVDAAIDPELFELVAILLVHVFAVDEKLLEKQRLPLMQQKEMR